MDPALRELLRVEPADRMVEAIIRFRRPGVELHGVRIVARFGRIATCRLPVSAVRAVWAHPDVVSLKAARPLGPDEDRENGGQRPGRALGHPRHPAEAPLKGAGVVCGVVDWGLDFDHPNFKHPNGSTRLIALWDQRLPKDGRPGARSPDPYGYGTVHTRRQIDRALRTAHPFRTLGYHPADADRGGGAHGTHVMDIAAGNGTVGPSGVAPEADLVFVHLANRGTGGLANLGDSVRLLEAVDFIARTAGKRPWVINLSLGRHGGPHDGTTLTELALDELLSAAPGRFICQSAGNYYRARAHATGVVAPGQRKVLRFVTDPADISPNELEIWYDKADEFAVTIDPPGTPGTTAVPLGDTADIVVAGQVCGRIYHRAHDPNNGDHHINAFLDPWAPAGEWQVTLEGRQVGNGRFHAWLERDEACRTCQTRFVPADASPGHTTGTIANGHLPLVVGSYDARSPARPPGPTSSAGPSRDDRPKPDLAAPGIGIVAARSAPRGSERSPGLLVRKTGTSMAAPRVTGSVALLLGLAGRRLDAAEIRRLVLSTTDSPAPNQRRTNRLGRGYLNLPTLLAAVHQIRPRASEAAAMEHDHITPLALAPARCYRELLYRPAADVSTWLNDRFTILARPGQQMTDTPQIGDVVLRAVMGRPGARGVCAIVAQPGLTHRRRSAPQEPSGWYAITSTPASAAGSRSLRVLDSAGLVPPGHLLLRPRPLEADLPRETFDERHCGCGSPSSRPDDSQSRIDEAASYRDWSAENDGSSEPAPLEHRIGKGGLPPLRQANPMACWATVATMMVSWKDSQSYPVEKVLAKAGQHYVDLYKCEKGLPYSNKQDFLSRLGMVGEPPASYSAEAYRDMLLTYGPLWVTVDADESAHFSGHALVVPGISADLRTLEVVDPNTGMSKRMSFQKFSDAFSAVVTEGPSVPSTQVVHFTSSDEPPWEEGNPAKEVNDYDPTNPAALIINMAEFTTGIADFRNYKDWKTNAAIPHNKRRNGYRTPTTVRHIVLHETAADTGDGFDDSHNTTSHLAVQRNATIKQFNDLVEFENHAKGMNTSGVGIEFVNRGWLSSTTNNGGEGIPAREANMTAAQKATYAEANGYIWTFWGYGFNIYKPPVCLAQLEKEVELLAWLTDTLSATVQSAPAEFQNMAPTFNKDWLQLVSYDHVKDKWTFPDPNIPAAADRATKNLFVMTTGYDVLQPAQLRGTSGIVSHNATYDGHSDGSFLSLYTWLRMEKRKPSQDAFGLCKSLMKNHWFRVTPKSDPNKRVVILDVSDANLV